MLKVTKTTFVLLNLLCSIKRGCLRAFLITKDKETSRLEPRNGGLRNVLHPSVIEDSRNICVTGGLTWYACHQWLKNTIEAQQCCIKANSFCARNTSSKTAMLVLTHTPAIPRLTLCIIWSDKTNTSIQVYWVTESQTKLKRQRLSEANI
jgi:hypothetical protein